MSGALAVKRRLRAQARATGQARMGDCIIGEMARRHEPSANLSSDDLLARLRVLEIEKLIRTRHGAIVPDARGTDDLPAALAYLTGAGGGRADVDTWARRWLPWLDDQAVLQAARELAHKLANGKRGARILAADNVAMLLNVTLAERERLGLKTIGACDLPREKRLKEARVRKQIADQERKTSKRRKAGVISRADFLAASLSLTCPWEIEGISRATWYRRRRETGPSRVIGTTYAGDEPVSSQPGCMEPPTAASSNSGLDPATAATIVTKEPGPHPDDGRKEERNESAKRERGSGASPPAGVSRGAGPAGAIYQPVSSTETRRTTDG